MSRTFQQIFEYIQTTDVNYCVVRASYLEIYNEEIKDLLNKHNPNKLVVKEHPEKGIQQTSLLFTVSTSQGTKKKDRHRESSRKRKIAY